MNLKDNMKIILKFILRKSDYMQKQMLNTGAQPQQLTPQQILALQLAQQQAPQKPQAIVAKPEPQLEDMQAEANEDVLEDDMNEVGDAQEMTSGLFG